MKCNDVQANLPDYLAGSAAEDRRVGIQAHLATCAGCRQDVEMWERLGALPDQRPSEALRGRVMDMIAAYRAGAEHTERPARRRWSFSGWLESWWPYRPALQFGVAIACLVVGLAAGYQIAARGAHNGELARLQDEVHKTRQLVTVSLLQQDSASERLRGVTYAFQTQHPDAEVLQALIHTVKYDDSVDVRLSAIDALKRYASEPAVRQGIVDALRAPQSPLVQIALIDVAVETRLRQAVDALRTLKEKPGVNELVRRRADWGLQQF